MPVNRRGCRQRLIDESKVVVCANPTLMSEFHIHTEQTLSAPLDRVFAFFSDAGNLESLTPAFLKFRVETPRPIEMREGALIDYSLRLHAIPIRWRTRIHIWEPGRRFVDEQIKGPYRLWIHEHAFEQARDGGTIVRDHVRYRPPLGAIANTLFVRPQLRRIFEFRAEATRRLIDQPPSGFDSIPTRSSVRFE